MWMMALGLMLGAGGGAWAQQPGQLMSCDVLRVETDGEGSRAIYSNNCRPVTSAEVVGYTNDGDGPRAIYGAQQPTLGGGPAQVLMFGTSTRPAGELHYGPPLDGNPATRDR
jgi:hypothetical protein